MASNRNVGLDRDSVEVNHPALAPEALLELLERQGDVGHRRVQLARDEVPLPEGAQVSAELQL